MMQNVVPTFRPDQQYTIDFIKTRPAAGIFLDMGLGKTLSTLTALKEMLEEKTIYGNILIVAPKVVSIHTWVDEIKKWDHLKDLPIEVLTTITSKKKRLERYEQILSETTPKIYTVNYEKLKQMILYYDKKWPFPNIVFDEIQYLRSHTNKTTKEIVKLHKWNNQYIEQARQQNDYQMYLNRPLRRIIGLTGTPAPKGYINLWGELACLDGGRRLGPNITNYRNTWFYPQGRTKNGDGFGWTLRNGAQQEIIEQISDICLSMESKDKVKLPKIIYNNVKVTLSNEEREIYETLKKEKILDVVTEEIHAKNAGVLVSQLLQLANGALYGNKDAVTQKQETYLVHDKKLDALEQIVDQAQEQPLLVFYWFKSDLKRLKQRFPQAEVYNDKDRTVIERWNKKEIPMLIANPKSIGVGANIQYGSHIMIWFSLPMYNLELYQQSVARLYRPGQTETVIVHHILSAETVDEDMMERLFEKRAIQQDVIEQLKPVDDKHSSMNNIVEFRETTIDNLTNTKIQQTVEDIVNKHLEKEGENMPSATTTEENIQQDQTSEDIYEQLEHIPITYNRNFERLFNAPLPVHIFGSSSKGNSVYIKPYRLLIDLAMPKKAYLEYDKDFFNHVDSIILTHDHGDHLNPSTLMHALTYPHIKVYMHSFMWKRMIRADYKAIYKKVDKINVLKLPYDRYGYLQKGYDIDDNGNKIIEKSPWQEKFESIKHRIFFIDNYPEVTLNHSWRNDIKFYPLTTKHGDLLNIAIRLYDPQLNVRWLYASDLDNLEPHPVSFIDCFGQEQMVTSLSATDQYEIMMLEANYDENIILKAAQKLEKTYIDEHGNITDKKRFFSEKTRIENNSRHISEQTAFPYVQKHLVENGIFIPLHASRTFGTLWQE